MKSKDQIELAGLIEVDRLNHEPARGAIMAVLMGVGLICYKTFLHARW